MNRQRTKRIFSGYLQVGKGKVDIFRHLALKGFKMIKKPLHERMETELPFEELKFLWVSFFSEIFKESITSFKLRIKTQNIFPNFTGKPGDIDLIFWNENLSFLGAAEVKHWNFKESPQTQKNLPKKGSGLNQAKNLTKLGFDKVYLIHIITFPPDYYIVPQVEDLEKAVYRIIGAKKILERIEKEKIPVGYAIVPLKDTKDKLPEERGSLGLHLYRPAPKIKINEDLKQKREKLVEFIKNQKL